MTRFIPASLAIAFLLIFGISTSQAQRRNATIPCAPHYSDAQPDLFYNYYVGANCGQYPAAMYTAPIQTPPLVGHTYFTYQPLYPHEYLYMHKRNYHHYYNDGGPGLSRTHVTYGRTLFPW